MAVKARTYNDAIDCLNTLQTPYAIISARRKAGVKPDAHSLEEMRGYLARVGYSPSDLNALNIIHVAGTKGKGSTCAFVNSILSQYVWRRPLGLFTSPHLIAVRERIRINSRPIPEEMFAKYFFEVWDRLEETSKLRDQNGGGDGKDDWCVEHRSPLDKPNYGRFLTLLSYHVFLREEVSPAIYETGIGGAYDATNLVPQPLATGISSLGIDHTAVLGHTPAEIAWHKAGIMKTGSPAFAVVQDDPDAAQVLWRVAAEKGVELTVVEDEDRRLQNVRIRPDARFQRRNAALAVSLAEVAVRKVGEHDLGQMEMLPEEFRKGLESVVWRGRCEVRDEGRVIWHVDGAHTADSLRQAAQWFIEECETRCAGLQVLIFNQQGRPEAVDFLDALCRIMQTAPCGGFTHAIFCTNQAHAETGCKRDSVNHQNNPDEITQQTVQHRFAERWRRLDPAAAVSVVHSIEEAISRVRGLAGQDRRDGGGGPVLQDGQTMQVLVTGSLHLVGGALELLEGADAAL